MKTGCTDYTKLSFLTKLYRIKCKRGFSDVGMSDVFELLSDAFSKMQVQIPPTFYEAKKTITKLGSNYIKIDVCKYDCMLYWGQDAELDRCKRCNTRRYKKQKEGSSRSKKLSRKSMRYFPLRGRLQRLFLSRQTAEHMCWHHRERNNDGKMRHPRDGDAWKAFNNEFPDFAGEPRNVRLGLASDGFNPFGACNQKHSIWPVVLIPYNLPPWMCMKQSSFILSTIIPGPKSPGNDIDVYLQPLIEELRELWTYGVETFDAQTNSLFTLRAALMWTISDFPGLGMLSGWNTHTGKACPYCNFDQEPLRLIHSKKSCFMGHRRFLPPGHRFRREPNKFNGKQERRNPPLLLTGVDIYEQVCNLEVEFGKEPSSDEEDGDRNNVGRRNPRKTRHAGTTGTS